MVEIVHKGKLQTACLLVLGLSLAQSAASNLGSESQTLTPNFAQTTSARFTVDARVNQVILAQVDVRLSCNSATPAQQQVTLDFDGTHEFTVSIQGTRGATCTLVPLLPSGQNVTYVGDGGSVIELDHHGCHYTGVSPGHANFCQVQVGKEATRLTVYKRWIGGTGEEPNIHIHLVCNQQTQDIVLWINADSAQTWELEVSDPDGIRCSVYEDELESFRVDQSDCSDLLILLGADEACTLVNTKVVKRIETLNRYGLGAMILIMLTAGLLAIKRLVR